MGSSRGDPSDSRPLGRRAFLVLVGGGVSSLWWGGAAWRGLSDVLTPAAGLLPRGLRESLPSPSSGWRIYTVNPPMPRFHRDSWRLKIDGLVASPRSFTYDELLALPRAEQQSDFHCVTGWSVPGVRWAGVRFADLLAASAPAKRAGAATFESAERPYTDSLTLDQTMADGALLAYEMDGRPLKREHGAPVRLVMPRMYGYKSVKWVSRITLTERPEIGYWEQRGYDRDAWVGRSNGRA